MLRRAMLRGRNVLKHPRGRMVLLLKSVIAVPLYALVVAAMLLLGPHWFMRYAIKLCDHVGRLLALVRLNPVRTREM